MLIIDPPNPVIQQSSIHSDLAAIIDTEKRVTVLLFLPKESVSSRFVKSIVNVSGRHCISCFSGQLRVSKTVKLIGAMAM